MATKANQPIRFWKRIGICVWESRLSIFVRDVIGAFLNIQEEDGMRERGEKTVSLAARRALYFAMDYGLMFLSGALVIAMKVYGFSFPQTFVGLWMFDLVTAGLFLAYYLKTGNDLSLGVDFRRATDEIGTRAKWAGHLATAGVMLLAVVWTGPEKIITYFRKEIGTKPRMAATLLGLTSIQAIVWMPVYWYGHSLYEIIRDSL